MFKQYDGGKLDSTNFVTTDYLYVNSCGVQSTRGARFQMIRENGRVDYHILYIINGNCRVYYGGKYHALEAGNYVFYEPGHKQEYLYDEGVDTRTFWLHFHGTAVETVLKDCNLSYGPHNAEKNSRLENIFEKLVNASYPAAKQVKTYANGLLLLLLSELGGQRKNKEIPKAVAEVLEYIHLNYFLSLDIDELAKKCGLSRSRLMHVFKEVTGTSMLNYHLQFRLEKSKELLAVKSLSVAQVASMTGFEDALYFSRVFRKYVGMAPSDYRKSLRREA